MEKLIFALENLQLKSGKRYLNIQNIEFQINNSNNVVAILGDSGLGKTTIFKSLFRAYIQMWEKECSITFSCNHIINGNSYSDHEIRNKKNKPNFGFATQIPYFDNSKNVKSNLLMPLKWLKNSLNKAQVDNFISTFELSTEILEARMHELSGGQRQIINIARAFLSNPELVIIDECFSNMNPTLAEKYIRILLDNYKDCIFIITSHRETDIRLFNPKIVQIVEKKHLNGVKYVTTN